MSEGNGVGKLEGHSLGASRGINNGAEIISFSVSSDEQVYDNLDRSALGESLGSEVVTKVGCSSGIKGGMVAGKMWGSALVDSFGS